MDFQNILNIIYKDCQGQANSGKVANYIPELAKVDPQKFGMCLVTKDLKHYQVGHSQELFSIQSIVKVFSLCIAKEYLGDALWKRVSVEPSGTPFNSLTELERENGIPRNPFINAGAIVVTDALLSILEQPKRDFLKFVRQLAGDSSISYNHEVAQSESDHGYRNTALTNYMKALGNIDNSPEAVLDLYYHMCSLEMSCEQLAKTFLVFANQGKLPATHQELISPKSAKRINAIMQTCGFYDEAGEFAYKVGLPGKSGVGGGIVAVHPDAYAVAVWSPRLNKKGNSVLGISALESLTSLSGLSVF